MFKSLAYEAMLFAREKHSDQVRKYTGEPYFNHLAEVVAISMSVGWQASMIHPDKVMAVAWLHDVVEDCAIADPLLVAWMAGWSFVTSTYGVVTPLRKSPAFHFGELLTNLPASQPAKPLESTPSSMPCMKKTHGKSNIQNG